MNPAGPYTLIDLASENQHIPGPDGQRITEYRIPSVLTREQCVNKFHRGCPSKSLLTIFYACLEAIAKPLIPGSPPVRKLGVFPGRDSGMVEWAVECAQLAGELVHGEPSCRLIFPGTHFGDALAAVMEEAKVMSEHDNKN